MFDFYWFSLCVALNGLLLLLLTINVSRLRIKNRVSYGDGGNKPLMLAIRVHANGVEQVMMFALVLLALTMARASETLLAVLVLGFTLSRLMHAYGMLGKAHRMRQLGAGITYLAQAVAVMALLLELLG
ncbi:MAPEG family protein [Aestuariirhabdus sp. LZHN29]|uniref:MAPEG family protein n=1 Tax=Aestuariirhabdus sp. LZHN29 TaxID=3417462 RepID=UPI003CE891D3